MALVAALFALSWVLRRVLRMLLPSSRKGAKAHFWSRQAISLLVAAVGAIDLASIWFDNPRTMTAALGLFTAALGFALQRVITFGRLLPHPARQHLHGGRPHRHGRRARQRDRAGLLPDVAIARDVLGEVDRAGIGIASATNEISAWPPLVVERKG